MLVLDPDPNFNGRIQIQIQKRAPDLQHCVKRVKKEFFKIFLFFFCNNNKYLLYFDNLNADPTLSQQSEITVDEENIENNNEVSLTCMIKMLNCKMGLEIQLLQNKKMYPFQQCSNKRVVHEDCMNSLKNRFLSPTLPQHRHHEFFYIFFQIKFFTILQRKSIFQVGNRKFLIRTRKFGNIQLNLPWKVRNKNCNLNFRNFLRELGIINI